MKHTVTKTFTFDTGHRLSNYEGKCKRLHGHTYKLEVTVGCNVLDTLGMVIDFNTLKDIHQKYIDAKLDHKTLLYKEDPINQALGNAVSKDSGHFVWTSFNPTAENIASYIFLVFESRLPKERNLRVLRIKLYETPTSSAEVIERPFGKFRVDDRLVPNTEGSTVINDKLNDSASTPINQ